MAKRFNMFKLTVLGIINPDPNDPYLSLCKSLLHDEYGSLVELSVAGSSRRTSSIKIWVTSLAKHSGKKGSVILVRGRVVSQKSENRGRETEGIFPGKGLRFIATLRGVNGVGELTMWEE